MPAAANFAGGRDTLPGVSKYSFDVIGLCEPGPASVRLAYNYRSANVDGFGARGVFTTVYSDAVGRLDLSASYNVHDNIALTVDATNLVRTPYHSYVKDARYPRDVRWEASLLSAGVLPLLTDGGEEKVDVRMLGASGHHLLPLRRQKRARTTPKTLRGSAGACSRCVPSNQTYS
ncbi:hypothetical protein [Sphingomonas sp. Leaf231]|uniref:hypothetical protein n=1 Tax=Sphingomonas sp. Leaf231 TaxID=1736301 RepID=UPI0012E3178E|nr:hypothetical protein [Sphingomonas sp. Leaf231]